mmetsp:Transcript_86040/g.267752  ORF Transcript_86040/g.267752 Transcript_86040/m.267752 type:complete len:388 (+) Transcript_86040:71-1234(+)
MSSGPAVPEAEVAVPEAELEQCIVCLAVTRCAHVRPHGGGDDNTDAVPAARLCGPHAICVPCSEGIVTITSRSLARHGQFMCPVCRRCLGSRRRSFQEGADALRWGTDPAAAAREAPHGSEKPGNPADPYCSGGATGLAAASNQRWHAAGEQHRPRFRLKTKTPCSVSCGSNSALDGAGWQHGRTSGDPATGQGLMQPLSEPRRKLDTNGSPRDGSGVSLRHPDDTPVRRSLGQGQFSRDLRCGQPGDASDEQLRAPHIACLDPATHSTEASDGSTARTGIDSQTNHPGSNVALATCSLRPPQATCSLTETDGSTQQSIDVESAPPVGSLGRSMCSTQTDITACRELRHDSDVDFSKAVRKVARPFLTAYEGPRAKRLRSALQQSAT